METFNEYKLLNEARAELKKAFKKNAALRATKQDLERKVEKIRQQMLENEDVNKILALKKYAKLQVLQDKKFLTDIEEEVGKEYRAAQRKSKRVAKAGKTQERTRHTLPQKTSLLYKVIKKINKEEFSVKEIEKALKAEGINSSVKAYLKPLGLPEGCFQRVSSSPADGTTFKVKASKELSKLLKD